VSWVIYHEGSVPGLVEFARQRGGGFVWVWYATTPSLRSPVCLKKVRDGCFVPVARGKRRAKILADLSPYFPQVGQDRRGPRQSRSTEAVVNAVDAVRLRWHVEAGRGTVGSHRSVKDAQAEAAKSLGLSESRVATLYKADPGPGKFLARRRWSRRPRAVGSGHMTWMHTLPPRGDVAALVDATMRRAGIGLDEAAREIAAEMRWDVSFVRWCYGARGSGDQDHRDVERLIRDFYEHPERCLGEEGARRARANWIAAGEQIDRPGWWALPRRP
jgi:hypothetical protein